MTCQVTTLTRLALTNTRRIVNCHDTHTVKMCHSRTRTNAALPVRRLLGDGQAGANRCAQMSLQLHVRSYRCPTFCVKRIASGHLITHQVSAQSIPNTESIQIHTIPFPRYGKGVRTCTCTPPLTFVKRQASWYLTTNQISAQSVHPFPRYRKGAHLHMRTWHVQMYPTHDLCYMDRRLVS